jgi:hypothetical protein
VLTSATLSPLQTDAGKPDPKAAAPSPAVFQSYIPTSVR